MTYAVKEIFYTLQGEGMNAGRAAVFLRFAGCNLWSGRAEDRASGRGGCSAWCDTDFIGTDGTGGGRYNDAVALADAVGRTWAPVEDDRAHRFVVCTGGEPLLQLDAPLIEALHARGFRVAVETNGTQPVPPGIDWLCVSPKAGAPIVVTAGDELKLVFPQIGLPPSAVANLAFKHFIIQPKDNDDIKLNTRLAVKYCLMNPQWKLGIQTHKVIGLK